MPIPMYPQDKSTAGGHGHDGNYRFYPAEENRHQDDDNLNLSLGLSGYATPSFRQQFDEIDTPRSLNLFPEQPESPRRLTPRSRELFEQLRDNRRRMSLGLAIGSSPVDVQPTESQTPTRRRRRSRLAQDEMTTPSQFLQEQDGTLSQMPHYERGGASSSSYFGQAGPSSSIHYPGNLEVGGSSSSTSSSNPLLESHLYSEGGNQSQILLSGFTQRNMKEIPIISNVFDQASQDNRAQEEHSSHRDRLHERKRLRQWWEENYPLLAIPLRLLSSQECLAIGVGRGTPRYKISLWLEDRFLRSNDLSFGKEILEPHGWRGHHLYERLAERTLDPIWPLKLKETQMFLDGLFDQAEMFKDPLVQRQVRRNNSMAAISRQDRIPISTTNAREKDYQAWTRAHHGILVPLHFFDIEDLKQMGLRKDGIKYQLARFFEQDLFKQMGYADLCGIGQAQYPDLQGRKLSQPLTISHPLEPESYLSLKQKQVQNWFLANHIFRDGVASEYGLDVE